MSSPESGKPSEAAVAIEELSQMTDRLEAHEWDLLRLKARPIAEVFATFCPDATMLVSESGRIICVDAKINTLFGYTGDELINQQVEVLIPADRRDIHILHRKEFMATPSNRTMGVGIALAVHGLRKDGVEFPIGVSLMPGVIDVTRVVCVICTAIVRPINAEALKLGIPST
jgi:PAS domain S-box-containing protein